eukprot:4448085-Amphidinium_carterae.1
MGVLRPDSGPFTVNWWGGVSAHHFFRNVWHNKVNQHVWMAGQPSHRVLVDSHDCCAGCVRSDWCVHDLSPSCSGFGLFETKTTI